MSETVVSVENLGKRYRIGVAEQHNKTFPDKILNIFRQPIKQFQQIRQLTSFSAVDGPDIIWALRNITFEVREGDIVGIIGRNGAGKTTLLKILSRIASPTEGAFELTGKISSLLEVGTGFHPELTGRENVYLNGAILGMKKEEIDRRSYEIIKFSGIERYLDTPVKRYSSGMRVRLAFSVAAHLNSDILLVDEVLAVGDLEFQKKCLGKMNEISKQNRTVLFVSHNIGTVRSLCTRGIYLVDGKIAKMGDINSVCNNYIKDIQTEKAVYSNNSIKVEVQLKGDKGNEFKEWRYLEWMIVEVTVESPQEISSPAVDLSFYSGAGNWIAAFRSDLMTDKFSGKRFKNFKMIFRFQNPGLTIPDCYLNVGVRNSKDYDRYGGDIYIALIKSAAVIPISKINLPRYHKSDTICYFPSEICTQI